MNKLNKIRQLLGQEIKLEQIKLDNGVVLEAESFEQGQNVFVISEDERIPLPAGEYQLEDGRVLTVVDEGVIAGIGEPEEITEEAENQDMEKEATPKKTVKSITEEQHFSDETIEVLAEKVFNMLEAKLESYTIAVKEEEGDAELVEKLEAKPEELAKVETKEVEIISHSPEKKAEREPMKYGTKRVKTVKDRVFAKMFN